MTTFIDVSVRDLLGASAQWRSYVTDKLGFDSDISVQVGLDGGKPFVWITAKDAFQKNPDRPYAYGEQTGALTILENYAVDAEWGFVCSDVWERLQKAMKRDERELRFSMSAMGGLIERAPSLTSAVGKMIADRIKSARDEATQYMIEHHGWQPAE
jgi:hypothetical protein